MEKYSSKSFSIGFYSALFYSYKSLSEDDSERYISLINSVDGYEGDSEILEYIEKIYHLTLTSNNL